MANTTDQIEAARAQARADRAAAIALRGYDAMTLEAAKALMHGETRPDAPATVDAGRARS